MPARTDCRTPPMHISWRHADTAFSRTIDVGLYVQVRKVRRPQVRGIDRGGQLPHMKPIAEYPAEIATARSPATRKATSSRGPARHPGETNDTPGHSGPNGLNGCKEFPRKLREETLACARSAAPTLDLRSGERDNRARAPGRAARDPSLLYRSLIARGHR